MKRTSSESENINSSNNLHPNKRIIQTNLDRFLKNNHSSRGSKFRENSEIIDKQGIISHEDDLIVVTKNLSLNKAETTQNGKSMSDLENEVGTEWYNELKGEFTKPYMIKCQEIVKRDREKKKVYPPEPLVFNAFKLTPLSKIKVVIVGQDPYHQPNQAMGLCFSVQKGIKLPPSLKNIFKEIGMVSEHGDLTSWAMQGVFLLNSLLTVIDSEPMAHKNAGWDQFTDKVIDTINEKCDAVVFLLWGKPAQKKASKVDTKKHHILSCGHPSPLSVRFFEGCKHFETCNKILASQGKNPINWNLI